MKKGESYRKVKIKAKLFDQLVKDKVITLEYFELQDYGIEGEEYKSDNEWVELKAKSNKAFKELKKREYILRNE